MWAVPGSAVIISDPETNQNAKKFDSISFDDVYNNKLSVMDMTAFTLCKENKLPIYIFNINKPGNLLKLVNGDHVGTVVHV